jgi:hypothetical protein
MPRLLLRGAPPPTLCTGQRFNRLGIIAWVLAGNSHRGGLFFHKGVIDRLQYFRRQGNREECDIMHRGRPVFHVCRINVISKVCRNG